MKGDVSMKTSDVYSIKFNKKYTILLLASLLMALIFTNVSEASPTTTYAMFDDFNYTSSNDSNLAAHQWSVKTGVAGPGPAGATWSANNITFVNDSNTASNKLLRLTSSTNGTPSGTSQAEILTPTKYFEGTYAARVKFSDTPVSGNDGDGIAQTFFTISPLRYDNDPTYSELDFEYLSNGGWGVSGPTLWTTSWYTYSNNPWSKDNVYNYSNSSFSGWHTLVLIVKNGQIKYYADGNLLATHSGKYYPRANMAIDFNQWFLAEALMTTGGTRSYQMDVDWVYHAKDMALTPAQVDAEIQNYRTQSISFTDNVTLGGTTQDTQAPTAPSNLISTGKTGNSVTLAWNASSDNIGVTNYDVYQDGVRVLGVDGTTSSATVNGLLPNTSYNFTVKAKDAAGNVSSTSNSINITTSATSTGSSWEAYHYYAVNDVVTYAGQTYKCLIAHTSQPNWLPSILPTMWQLQTGN